MARHELGHSTTAHEHHDPLIEESRYPAGNVFNDKAWATENLETLNVDASASPKKRKNDIQQPHVSVTAV